MKNVIYRQAKLHVIRAIAIKQGMKDSQMVEAVYDMREPINVRYVHK